MKTILDNVNSYEISSYLTSYDGMKRNCSIFYHMIHIDQLAILWQMTGIPEFLEMHYYFKTYFLKKPKNLLFYL